LLYFVINIIVGCTVLITSIIKGKNKFEILIYYTIGFFFILFIGLKGNDDEYTKLFFLIPTLDIFFSDLVIALEKGPLFAFISSFFKSLGLNSQSLLLFFTFSSISIHLIYYRKFTKYYLLALLFYLSHEVIFHEWILIRAGLASAMVLPMIYYLNAGNKKLFYIYYILSCLIHYISIISIILIFINRRIDIKWLFTALLISFIIYFSGGLVSIIRFLESANVLPPIIDLYLNWSDQTYAAGLFHPKTFQQIFTSFLILFLLFNKNRFYSNSINPLILNTYILSTILQIVLNDLSIFAFRTAGHFYIVEPIIIAYLIIFFRAKKLALSFAVIICISISYINYVVQERLDTYQFLVKPGGKFYYDKITGKPNWVEGK
jgi:hypothetical protein